VQDPHKTCCPKTDETDVFVTVPEPASGQRRLLLNPGYVGYFTDTTTTDLPPVAGFVRYPTFADLNNDRFPDLYIPTWCCNTPIREENQDRLLINITSFSSDFEVTIDVKPGSDPNCFNINGHGVVPVAILGSDTFDVYQINQSSLLFAGLEARVRGNKGPFCSFQDSNADGFTDLVCLI